MDSKIFFLFFVKSLYSPYLPSISTEGYKEEREDCRTPLQGYDAQFFYSKLSHLGGLVIFHAWESLAISQGLAKGEAG